MPRRCNIAARAAQVVTARTLTTPAVHPRTGETIFPSLALGTELGWATRIGGPVPNPLGSDFVKYAVFKSPDWDWRTFDLETAVAHADRIDVIDADVDLRAFMQRGGKLLLYHGWADQNFSAQSTIDYYHRVVSTIGSTQAEDSLRLFLAPGVGHCGVAQDRTRSTQSARLNGGWRAISLRRRWLLRNALTARRIVVGRYVPTRKSRSTTNTEASM